MAQYRTKPEVIEAEVVAEDTVSYIVNWTGGLQVEEFDPFIPGKKYVAVNIPGVSGMFRASEGDYVIRDERGRFSKLSSREFHRMYEEV